MKQNNSVNKKVGISTQTLTFQPFEMYFKYHQDSNSYRKPIDISMFHKSFVTYKQLIALYNSTINPQ